MENVEGTAPVEPTMPTVTETPKDSEEIKEYEQENPVEETVSETPTEETSEKPQSETPSAGEKTEPVEPVKDSKQFDDIISGWKEDRETLAGVQKENSELKAKLSKLEEQESYEEYSDLSESERIDAIVKKRESETQQASELEKQQTQKEIQFYERTDTYFAQNKARVLDIAVKFNAQNLSQAIMIAKGQDNVVKTPKAPAKPKPVFKNKETPKQTNPNSFGDMYRQGGIN